MSKIELTKAQKMVVDLMRNGWDLVFSPLTSVEYRLMHLKERDKGVRRQTVEALVVMGIIERKQENSVFYKYNFTKEYGGENE